MEKVRSMLSRFRTKPDENFRTQLLRGGIAGLFIRICVVLSGLISSIALTRLLGPETFGIYAFVFSIITLLSLPIRMGLPTLVLRETARADQSDDGGLLKGIWQWSDRAIAIVGLIVVTGCALFIWFVTGVETPQNMALLAALPLMPIFAWAEVRAAAIRGLRRVAIGHVPDRILQPLLLAAIATLATHFWFETTLTAAQVYLLHLAVSIFTLSIATLLRKKLRPDHKGFDVPKHKTGQWVSAALPLSAIMGLQFVSQNTDILMIGAMATNVDVGLYRVALSGANIVLFGLTTVNLVLQPYFARAWSANDHRRLQSLATIGARVSLASALPAILLFWFGGPWLLKLVFGSEFGGAFTPLIYLCLGQLISALFGSVGNLLTMSGKEWVAMWGLVASTVVNVVLNWFLIPIYGIEGAAIATSISIVAWNIGLWVAAWVTIRIDSSPFGIARTPPVSLNAEIAK